MTALQNLTKAAGEAMQVFSDAMAELAERWNEFMRIMEMAADWEIAYPEERPVPKPRKQLGRPSKGYQQMKRPSYMRRM